MEVHFHLEAQLRHLAGRDRVVLSLSEPATLLHGLQRLAAEFPALRDYVLSGPEVVRPSLVIVVDQVPVHARQAPGQALREGSTVILLPPISGG